MHPGLITLPVLFALGAGDLGDWKRVTSKEGGFAVTMPGKVERKTINEQTTEGPAEVRALMTEINGITFLATGASNSAQVPVAKDSPFFDNVRESAMTGPGKVLQKEQRGTFQKMPMCYFRYAVTAPNGKPLVVQARYLIGDPTHIYTLQVYVPKGVNIDTEVKRFFESFDRVEATSPPLEKKGSKTASKDKDKADEGKIGPAIAAKWRSFSPTGKGFSVTLPGEPQHKNQDDRGNGIQIDSYVVDLGNRLYLATTYDFPAKVAEQEPSTVLENLCKGIATGMKGTVVELKPVKDDGLEGRELLFDFPGPDEATPVTGRVRAYLIGTKAYVLMYNGLKGTGDTEEVRKFLESFRQTKATAPGKAKVKARS